jgi:hypothetical protein
VGGAGFVADVGDLPVGVFFFAEVDRLSKCFSPCLAAELAHWRRQPLARYGFHSGLHDFLAVGMWKSMAPTSVRERSASRTRRAMRFLPR